MHRKSASQIYKRTLDYLARKHPWFDAVIRNRWMAFFILALYVLTVFFMTWVIHSGEDGGWKEVVKSYSPIFFDLLVIFLISPAFLLARGYFFEEATRIDAESLPDPALFFPITASSVELRIDHNDFFKRHAAIAAILDALPINQSDIFLAHAGSLDIPKLTLKEISISNTGKIEFTLGVAPFKEFFFTHHFADYVLSRTSARDSESKETLRSLFSPIYYRAYGDFFEGKACRLNFLAYTPNTLGVTGYVQIECGDKSVVIMQRRGFHESAGRGLVQLGYAGTISAFPDFADGSPMLAVEKLANDEFQDEFLNAEPGDFLRLHTDRFVVKHEVVGVCANSQYLFQPEIFMFTTVAVADDWIVDKFAQEFALHQRRRFLAFRTNENFEEQLLKSGLKIRPICKVAISRIYNPHLKKA